MFQKALGALNLSVSKIGLGLSQLGETKNKKKYNYISEKKVQKIIEYSISNNINFFDTADTYGNTERLLGRLSKKLKEKSIISTKIGPKYSTDNRIFKKKYLEKKIDQSLKNLKVEKIDIFMFNKPSYSEFIREDLINFINELKAKGKILASGIIVRDPLDAKKFLKIKEVDCFSVLYNLNELNSFNFIKNAYKKNKNIIIRSPLNSGLLAGKIDKDTKFNKNDFRNKYFSKNLFLLKMKKIEEIKNKLNISSNKIKNFSLDFIMANKMVSTVLVGCSSFKQLKEIVKYNKQKKVFNRDIYKKSFKILKNISKKYKIPNQL